MSTARDLRGRTYLVTGANAGLGYFASEKLARRGAHVIISGRNAQRVAAAARAIQSADAAAEVSTVLIDVSDPDSVRAGIADIESRRTLDGLLLNAGIVHPPRRRTTTPHGWELVIGTNALGHFQLAAGLAAVLERTARDSARHSRIVWLGSIATRLGRFDPRDIESRHGYNAARAYARSKVVTQALGFEAHARLRAADIPIDSIVAHPGFSLSGLTRDVPGVNTPRTRLRWGSRLLSPLAQSKERGAEPLVMALTDPVLSGGEYVGPQALFTGRAAVVQPVAATTHPVTTSRVWADCERLTGVTWL